MPAPLIALEPIEPDLSPDRVDQRLAAGWFPFGQAWMTCRAWPDEEGVPHDTVWLRVRLQGWPKGESDRHRRIRRDGCTEIFSPQPSFDGEHQALYDRFREALHPDWETTAVSEILVTADQPPGPLFAATREVAIRDAAGRLIAFRWFVEGRRATAGVKAVYDPSHSGLGTISRTLADRWAQAHGFTWTYPGYVRPGSDDPWTYKIKRGRSEWLDPERGDWRPWDGDEPDPLRLTVAEMRRRLAELGDCTLNPSWAAACFHPALHGLVVPYFVAGRTRGRRSATVWDVEARSYEVLFFLEPRFPQGSGS